MADEGNDFLKNEEENDPVKITKEQMELQKEGIRLMKEALAKKPQGQVGRGAYITAEAYLAPAELKTSMEFQVRKIQNGYILASRSEGRLGLGPYQDKAIEVFCPTAEELVRVAALKVEAFTKEPEQGTVRSGPPPFQLAPGESI